MFVRTLRVVHDFPAFPAQHNPDSVVFPAKQISPHFSTVSLRCSRQQLPIASFRFDSIRFDSIPTRREADFPSAREISKRQQSEPMSSICGRFRPSLGRDLQKRRQEIKRKVVRVNLKWASD
jgi:hypothetical protein